MSTFPPIAEYAFLSDCENSCLIAPDGAVEWLCLPRPDSPSVFGALLDRWAGSFRFGPSNTLVPHHRRYIPGTMVVETTWHTPTGWLVVQDFMVIRKVDEGARRPGYRRAPMDSAAVGVLLAHGHRASPGTSRSSPTAFRCSSTALASVNGPTAATVTAPSRSMHRTARRPFR